MGVTMRQLPRINAGQLRKIVPDLNKQIQALTRMPRMPRIIHRVRLVRLGFAAPRHAAIAGAGSRLGRKVHLVVARYVGRQRALQ
jgi:hypothetical protein